MSNTEFKSKIRQILDEFEGQIRSDSMSSYSSVYKNGAISRIEAAHIKNSIYVRGKHV